MLKTTQASFVLKSSYQLQLQNTAPKDPIVYRDDGVYSIGTEITI